MFINGPSSGLSVLGSVSVLEAWYSFSQGVVMGVIIVGDRNPKKVIFFFFRPQICKQNNQQHSLATHRALVSKRKTVIFFTAANFPGSVRRNMSG